MALTAEEAEKRIEALREPRWQEERHKRSRKLRWRLRRVAGVLASPRPERAQWRERQEHEVRARGAARRLDEIEDADLLQVMQALHPSLGGVLARWWRESVTQPYLREWDRRAFRSTDPSLSLEARTSELLGILESLGGLAVDTPWLVSWGAYLAAAPGHPGVRPEALGGLIAAGISEPGDEALEGLLALVAGDDPVGVMGRHAIIALARCGEPRGWDALERLLLAAQRQEGLRQSILEAADEAHPQAFDRLLELVLTHKLLRFAASIRAAGVWLGFAANVENLPQVERRVELLGQLRTDEQARQQALRSTDPWMVHTALVAAAQRDVAAAISELPPLLSSPDSQLRAVGLRFAHSTRVGEIGPILIEALRDEDLAVASLATLLLPQDVLRGGEAFEALEALAGRLPAKTRPVTSLGVELEAVKLSRSEVCSRLVHARGKRPLEVLLPWISSMDATGRWSVAHALAREKRFSPQLRELLLELLADRSSSVREQAAEALGKITLTPSETPSVEALLSRTGTEVRRCALGLLARQPRPQARASASRLSAGDSQQQKGALELLGLLGDPVPADLQARVGGGEQPPPVRIDARAALLADTHRTPGTPPRSPRGRQARPAEAIALAAALDAVGVSARNTPVRIGNWAGAQEVLLGDVQWLPEAFPGNVAHRSDDVETEVSMVLPEKLHAAFAARSPASSPGLDALHTYVSAHASAPPARYGAQRPQWLTAALTGSVGVEGLELEFAHLVRHGAGWLTLHHADTQVVERSLQGLEDTLGAIPERVLRNPGDKDYRGQYSWRSDWRGWLSEIVWLNVLEGLLAQRPEIFTEPQLRRWMGLMAWISRPYEHSGELPLGRRLLIRAHAAGAASDGDILASMLSERSQLLSELTRRRPPGYASQNPAIRALAEQVRDTLLEAELQRGDVPTPTSALTHAISSTSGARTCTRLLATLGKGALTRGYVGYNTSRDAVMSHLIRVCFPDPADTAAVLSAAADAHQIPQRRLVELAVYAPQWAPLVEGVLDRPGFADAVLWLHAHTKESHWSVDEEVRAVWAAMSAELTALPASDLEAGAVDVEWFQRSYQRLGAGGWKELDKAARLASSAGGHKRAQTFASAMLGELSTPELAARIEEKRNQDAVRALGLVPLREDRDADLRERYDTLREFERGSRKFGSQRQASEKLAVRIGVDNLARTAGYPDPQRFVWAMEAAQAGALRDGPVSVSAGDVHITLSVSREGVPELSVRRGERALASIPQSVKRDEAVVALKKQHTDLGRQVRRVRRSLEAAMVAADLFTLADLDALGSHPLVAPMLELLVWIDEKGRLLRREEGRFVSLARRNVKPAGGLRIAHPTDLLASGSWISWQEEMFARGERQPFKQVFRELYVPTAAESDTGPVSTRYNGHQVQPRQAHALLTARSWLTDPEGGDTTRVFHRHDVVAHLALDTGVFTPAEADLPTLDGVWFSSRGQHGPASVLAVPTVPPIVFSETMRDLDLVVSVAHAGGVDPEASESTTEMRATLVRETIRLLKLQNVEIEGVHVLIQGQLGEYSLHLGSGTVHRRPGGALCIIPVSAQYRGRLFLPFADDDPKTAEIVSKVVLLAEDHKIQDPTILEQLRS